MSGSLLDTRQIYADIKHLLHEAGYTLPENDIWIAAIAKQNGLEDVPSVVEFESVTRVTILFIGKRLIQ